MTMRIGQLTLYLQSGEAYALIDFLDQLRAMLMESYGDEIRGMLQEASPHHADNEFNDELPF